MQSSAPPRGSNRRDFHIRVPASSSLTSRAVNRVGKRIRESRRSTSPAAGGSRRRTWGYCPCGHYYRVGSLPSLFVLRFADQLAVERDVPAGDLPRSLLEHADRCGRKIELRVVVCLSSGQRTSRALVDRPSVSDDCEFIVTRGLAEISHVGHPYPLDVVSAELGGVALTSEHYRIPHVLGRESPCGGSMRHSRRSRCRRTRP